MPSSFKEKSSHYLERIHQGIDALLPPADTRPSQLHQAMRYSMEAGGKRIRPMLLLAAADLFPAKEDPIPAAVSIECLHTYTLIHDDLPALDNSDLRRGRPSCHKQFDEPTAILAGDALLTLAFCIPTEAYSEAAELACQLIRSLSQAAGSTCLIGGQQEDIENEGKSPDAETLDYIHRNKTAALLTAALQMGLLFAQPNRKQLERITSVGHQLGLCFQIVDDILDATSTADAMGKPVGSDAAAGKNTYVALHGIDEARKIAHRHAAEAIKETRLLGGNNEFLLQLIEAIEHRIQ